MEEIYLLMFLLVVFAVAIYLIIQIPEVKDYIASPSGEFGGVPTSSNSSNALSNRVTLSNTSNVLSNVISNIISNAISNSSNIVSSNSSNNLSNYQTLSNLGSNYSNVVSGTPISGVLATDLNSVFSNLSYNLFYDGSITPSPRATLDYANSMNSKLSFMTSSDLTDLNNRIETYLNSGNYATIEEVATNVKDSLTYLSGYLGYDIPPINTMQIINLNNLINDSFTKDTGFSILAITSVTTSNNIDTYNNMVSFRTYSAHWYLQNSNLSSNILISNYINVATSFLNDTFPASSN